MSEEAYSVSNIPELKKRRKNLKHKNRRLYRKTGPNAIWKGIEKRIDDQIIAAEFYQKHDWPCRNCKRRWNEHQGTHFGELVCEVERLSKQTQKGIDDGDVIPETDWTQISYQPMDNLQYAEWLHEQSRD